MGCCGRSNPNRITRSQKMQKQKAVKSRSASVRPTVSPMKVENKAVPPIRQKINVVNRCKECNYPIVLVNIAGREREQCANPKCRKIKR